MGVECDWPQYFDVVYRRWLCVDYHRFCAPCCLEPEYAGGEPVSAEEVSESSDSDTEARKEDEHDEASAVAYIISHCEVVTLWSYGYANAERKPLLPRI